MPATRSTVIGSSRSRRVATCASIRCCRTSSAIVSDVGLGESQPTSDLGSDHSAGDAVVALDALTEVVQQCGDQQQVRSAYVADHLRGLDTGLQQVPVDSEAVDRRLRRPEPHGVPLRQDPRDVAGLVQRLPHLQQTARPHPAGHTGAAAPRPATVPEAGAEPRPAVRRQQATAPAPGRQRRQQHAGPVLRRARAERRASVRLRPRAGRLPRRAPAATVHRRGDDAGTRGGRAIRLSIRRQDTSHTCASVRPVE